MIMMVMTGQSKITRADILYDCGEGNGDGGHGGGDDVDGDDDH